MGVDVADVLWLKLGIGEGVEHDSVGAIAVFGRLGDVVGVAAHAVADDLSKNFGAAAAGEFQFFQNKDAGALADYEAVALRVPGTAGLFGRIVTGGKRTHS